MSTHRLTIDEARRVVVRAQLLDATRAGDVVEVADQLGAIKIDPTAVIAPCEDTVCFSRIGYPYEHGQLVKAVETDRLLFELDGAFRPIDQLPLRLPGMRAFPRRESTRQWLEANAAFRADVLARLRADGPLLAGDLPDTAAVRRAPDGWSGANQVPILLDLLARQGVVAVAGRRGRHRLWDLAERVWPQDLPELDAAEAERGLSEWRLRAAGIARRSQWSRVGDAGEPAEIEGLRGRWRIDPAALSALGEDFAGRVAILNPYDGLLWDRPRLKELFGFPYVLEQFKKKEERRYGFFAHPVLLGDRFVAMLDASVDRSEGELQVRAIHELEPLGADDVDRVRAEVEELAAWLGVPVAESSAL